MTKILTNLKAKAKGFEKKVLLTKNPIFPKNHVPPLISKNKGINIANQQKRCLGYIRWDHPKYTTVNYLDFFVN